MMTAWLLYPYHRLLLLRGQAEEANFAGWCVVTMWVLIGYVVYTIELVSRIYT